VTNRSLVVLASIAVWAVLAAVLVSYVRDEARPGHGGPLMDPTDLVAFYCGAKGLAAHHDPYRAEPQRSCERAAFAESHIELMRHLVMPETLPPYAIVPFMPLSALSFRAACVAFLLLALLAAIVTIVATARLSQAPIAAIAAATLVSFALASMYIGQPVPLVVAALCASALALRAGNVPLATAFALFVMIEPHVGLAALAGLFVLVPRSRLWIAGGAVALAAISIAAGGVGLSLEYARLVVPAQALSEVGNFHAQYSLTALLHQLGASDTASLRIGEASYVVMLGLGVWLASRLMRAHGDTAFAVLTVPACVLVGGVYVHDHQMAVALPFAFLISRYAKKRALVYGAIGLLAVPWQSVFELFFVNAFATHVHFDPGTALAPYANGTYLSQKSWGVWISLLGGRDGRTPIEIALFKLPTWIALGAVGWFAIASARSGEGMQPRASFPRYTTALPMK